MTGISMRGERNFRKGKIRHASGFPKDRPPKYSIHGCAGFDFSLDNFYFNVAKLNEKILDTTKRRKNN
jgi:hypothetical protein